MTLLGVEARWFALGLAVGCTLGALALLWFSRRGR